MKEKRDIEVSAYFTVEASFILPMALAVLVMTLYMTCFACGRCRLVQDGMILCIRESSQKSAAAENRIRGLYEIRRGRYPLFSSAGADLSRGGSVRVSLSGQLSLMPAPVLKALRGKSLGVSAVVTAPVHDPPLKYRRYRRLACMAGKILESGRQAGPRKDPE